MNARPTVADERKLALRAELKSRSGTPFVSSEIFDRVAPVLAGVWKPSRGWFLRIVFYGLTMLALSFTSSFFALIASLTQNWKVATLLTGVLSLVAGELVIRQFHPYRSGVEEALWLSGLACLIVSLPSSGSPEALLVFAAAAAIVAWRCVTSGFMTIAVLLVITYAGVKLSSGSGIFHFDEMVAAWATLVTLVLAGAAILQTVRRPWIERMLATLITILPIALYLLVMSEDSSDSGPTLLIGKLSWPWTFGFLAIGTIAVALAINRRIVPLFYTAGFSFVVAGVEIARRIDIPISARCIGGGVVALAAAVLLERWLRTPRRGFTSESIGESSTLAFLQLAGNVAMQAASAPASQPPQGGGPVGGGGSFGGAGASGDY